MSGLHQCVGAIDGTHIPIIAPKEHQVDCSNRKHFHSIVLQAVLDHNSRFQDICVGWPGRVHDAHVLANSSLYGKGQNGTLFPRDTETIGGVDVPMYIAGDPAYPLLPWLMKVYRKD
ncbi:Hypothetical predicted protein [Paramuricea clavata]|uniref:Uncharacterized protein n=1 Tax=Paramuricea clavata TaxID=317549 RepID=A0A6S7K9Z9_PARCT|nr:Hypothetical predicted protein [Paramuricea clavata]